MFNWNFSHPTSPTKSLSPTAALIVTASITRSTLVTTTAAISLPLTTNGYNSVSTDDCANTIKHENINTTSPTDEITVEANERAKKALLQQFSTSKSTASSDKQRNLSTTSMTDRRESTSSGKARGNSAKQKQITPTKGISNKAERQKSKSENRARKALRTISFILGAFIICWTPYHIVALVEGFLPDSVNHHLFYFTYFLCYANR